MSFLQSNQRTLRLALVGAVLCCAQAGRAAGDSSAPVITHTPVARAPAGPVKIGAKITDESKIFPQVFFRYSGGAFEPPVDLKKVKGSKDQYEATVMGKAGLEYYVECYDEYGNGPARAGSPEQPFKVELEAEGSAAAPGTSAPPRPAPWLKGASSEGAASSAAAPEVHKAPPPEPAAVAEAAPRPEPVRSAPPPAVERHEGRDEGTRGRGVSTSLATPMTAEGALVRSLLLPGLGQWQDERHIRGILFGAAAAASATATIILAVRAKQANDVYETAPASARPQTLDQANSYASSRNIAIGLLVGVWVVNAAEAYFLHGTRDPW